MIERHKAARFDLTAQGLDGSLGIGCVLDDAEADHHIEARFGDRNVFKVGLANKVVLVTAAVDVICLDRGREVAGEHLGSCRQQHFGEPPSAAAGLENRPVFHHSEMTTEAPLQTIAGNGGFRVGVQLRLSVGVPLKTESGSVAFLRYKPRNAVLDLKDTSLVTEVDLVRTVPFNRKTVVRALQRYGGDYQINLARVERWKLRFPQGTRFGNRR